MKATKQRLKPVIWSPSKGGKTWAQVVAIVVSKARSWFRHPVPRKSSRKSPSVAFTGPRTRTTHRLDVWRRRRVHRPRKSNHSLNFPHALLKREDLLLPSSSLDDRKWGKLTVWLLYLVPKSRCTAAQKNQKSPDVLKLTCHYSKKLKQHYSCMYLYIEYANTESI